MDKYYIGEKLKKLRDDRDMTYEELAEKAHMNPKSVWQLESDLRGTTLTTLLSLCDALSVKPSYFLKDDLTHTNTGFQESEYSSIFEVIDQLTDSELSTYIELVRVTIANRDQYRTIE